MTRLFIAEEPAAIGLVSIRQLTDDRQMHLPVCSLPFKTIDEEALVNTKNSCW